MTDGSVLHAKISEQLASLIEKAELANNEVIVTVSRENLSEVGLFLRDHAELKFDMLIDVCGIDYLDYGRGEWETYEATATGFSRGRDTRYVTEPFSKDTKNATFGEEVGPVVRPRFAVAYQLLSIPLNHRIRIKVYVEETDLVVPSVVDIWPAANWFEREAFDLFGILFSGHPDLRRILTDYGFIGHPFRKDFPLIGNVEVRYDANLGRVVYEPVSITPRVLEPKVVRTDNRYEAGE